MHSTLNNWRRRLAALDAWPRRLAGFGFGVLAVGALPPLHLVFLLLPALTGLVWLIDASRAREPDGWLTRRIAFTRTPAFAAFAVGWWFGLGFFVAGLYWITFSFLVQAATFAWMIPFAIFGLSAYLAIYTGLTAWAAFVLAPAGVARALVLAVAWVGFEALRGWALTGFPWNLIGTVWTVSDGMLQMASVTGVLGLSLLTVLAAASPAALAGRGKPNVWAAGLPWIVLALIWGGGVWRLADAGNQNVDGVSLRLVQPNIAQRDKWNPELRGRHVNTLLDLSLRPTASGGKPTHVIWPETATPFFLSTIPQAIRVVAGVAPSGGALLTGSPRQGFEDGRRRIWNSFHVVGPDAKIRGTYDKYHLVPFGEYVPFRQYLNISSLTGGRTDFTPGSGPRAVEVPGAPAVVPLICYEAIFPGKVTPDQADGPRPGWLLNLTNDAWFGISSGPYQHFAATRLRAVEEGLPLVRVANTGISGVVDAYGRVVVRAGLETQEALDSVLPAVIDGATIFARHGALWLWVASLMLFGISRMPRLRNISYDSS